MNMSLIFVGVGDAYFQKHHIRSVPGGEQGGAMRAVSQVVTVIVRSSRTTPCFVRITMNAANLEERFDVVPRILVNYI